MCKSHRALMHLTLQTIEDSHNIKSFTTLSCVVIVFCVMHIYTILALKITWQNLLQMLCPEPCAPCGPVGGEMFDLSNYVLEASQDESDYEYLAKEQGNRMS